MADGAVIIGVDLDTKKADKELAKLKKEIQSTEDTIGELETKKSPLVAQAKNLRQEMQRARAEVDKYRQAWISGVVGADTQQARAHERLSQIENEYNGIAAQINKINDKLGPAYEKLDRMKEEAGGLQQNIDKAAKNTRKMEKATQKADKKMGIFATRLRGILLSAFVFNILSAGFRELTDWMGNVIKTNDKARASIAKLKAALLTLAQPLVDVIVPAFASITEFLAKAVTYIAQLVAILFGTTADSASDAANSLYDEQHAIEGVGTVAKKASKQLAAFDEINRLSGETATNATDVILPDFSSLQFKELPEWLTDMTVTLRDIVFEWENLSAEDVLKKVVSALNAIAGTIVGFSVGGVKGAAIGLTIGTSVGSLISSLLFDDDGVMNTEELLKSLCMALTSVAGGVIGFFAGGVKGAAVGVSVGAGVGVGLGAMLFDGDSVMSKEEILKSLSAALLVVAGGVLGFMAGGPFGAALGVLVGASLTASIGKMIFDGDGVMNKEELLSLLCVALGTVAGGVLGFFVGGPGGAMIGITVGAGVTAGISSLIFNGDGVMSAEEILTMICDALGTLTGGVLGFLVGGPGGAAIGATVGAGVSAYISKLLFDNDGKMSQEEIVKSVITALLSLVGGIIGFVAGGPGGAVLGVMVGATASIALSNFLFDGDGKVDKQELLKGLCSVLGGLVGGIIGFGVGGPLGAVIGATIGTSATLALSSVDFSSEKGQRIKQAIIDSLVSALYIAAGGAIGFMIGNVPGAIIGMTIGAALTISLKKVNVDDSGVKGFVNNFRGAGFTSTITTGNIPGFANGSVIPPNREFLAVLGDNKQETEVVSPLSTMKQAMLEAMRESGGGKTPTIVFEGELAALARILRPYIEEEGRRVGVSLVTK